MFFSDADICYLVSMTSPLSPYPPKNSARNVSRHISRRQILAATVPISLFGLAGLAQAQPLNTLISLDLPSPNTAIEDKSGQSRMLADYATQPLLINFWASWCPPCIHELPALEGLDRALADVGMGVLLVGADRKGTDFGEAFLADRNIAIRQRAYDPRGELARALSIRAMPTSFMMTQQGQIIGKVEGAIAWDDPAVIRQLVTMLKP